MNWNADGWREVSFVSSNAAIKMQMKSTVSYLVSWSDGTLPLHTSTIHASHNHCGVARKFKFFILQSVLRPSGNTKHFEFWCFQNCTHLIYVVYIFNSMSEARGRGGGSWASEDVNILRHCGALNMWRMWPEEAIIKTFVRKINNGYLLKWFSSSEICFPP